MNTHHAKAPYGAMKFGGKVAMVAAMALLIVSAGGCRGDRSESRPRQFLPDMDDSPKFKPQTKTEFFADRRAMRQPVAGTVAFGTSMDPADPTRKDKLKEDPIFFTGMSGKDVYAHPMPGSVTVSKDVLELGQEKFNIFCSACHGYDGAGKGTVGAQWSYALPNFHDAKYKDPKEFQGRDGYIFHVIRNGVIGPDGAAKMPAYGYNINEREAWAIVAYFRALQASRDGKINELPADIKQRLETNRPAVMQGQQPAAGSGQEGAK